MRIFIELPTWLGDSVMASSAINLLLLSLKNAEVVFFGSSVSVQLYKDLEYTKNVIEDNSKTKDGFRIINLYHIMQKLGKFDLAISFRSSMTSKFSLFCLQAKFKANFKNNSKAHQVQKYENFIKYILKKINLSIPKYESRLTLPFNAHNFNRPTLGINPGASYGSAKRWNTDGFIKVAQELCNEFDIIIFGGKAEYEICNKIAQGLNANGIQVSNLAGKTDIKQLCELIAGLSLFITNDSGPMHIAAAYKVPTVAIFGSTKIDETSPYTPANAIIVRLNPPLKCMPCMKRTCPLGTNACLNNISAQMVLKAVKNLLPKQNS